MSVSDRKPYDAAANGFRSYDLAIACAREKCIRSGQIKPRIGDEKEKRWAAEGPVPPHMLDAVRNDD